MQLARVDGETSEAEITLIKEIAKSKYVSDDAVSEAYALAQKEDRIPSVELDFCFDVVKKIGFSETQFFNLVVGVFDKENVIEEHAIRNYVETGLKEA